uniref:Putative secreted protein n=1 Tax=Anopheles darlingi TaxID=43151 RepID=A0A2M4DC05_ANODA
MMLPLLSTGFVLIDTSSCRNPVSMPRVRSNSMSPSRSFVLPERYLKILPTQPSSKSRMVQYRGSVAPPMLAGCDVSAPRSASFPGCFSPVSHLPGNASGS